MAHSQHYTYNLYSLKEVGSLECKLVICQRALPAERHGRVMARAVPKVLLLRLPAGRGGVLSVHTSQPPAL